MSYDNSIFRYLKGAARKRIEEQPAKTLNPKPQTLNPKPETQNPEPLTLNPKP